MMKAQRIGTIRTITLTLVLACLTVTICRAQLLPKLQSSFTAYQQHSLREKTYLHVNKDFYLAGEIVWFKVYNVDGTNNNPINLSKVVYVELLDDSHAAVLQAKISIKQGIGSGSLYLPFSLNSGHYILRAYTNWMKNFSADYFFEKQLTVINALRVQPLQAKSDTAGYDVQFFPEGGHLVTGLASKIAFKVTAKDGKGQTSTGAVINQHNDTIVCFKTLKFGMGSFMFTPAANMVYKAVVKVDKEKLVKPMPEVNEAGYVLQVADNGESWDVTVRVAGGTQPATIYMAAHNNNAVKLAERVELVNGGTHIKIEKQKLDEGLSYITLFDEQQKPLCERLVFKRPVKKLAINAAADAEAYGARKKVGLTISTKDKDSKALAADLSVSVFRVDALQQEGAEHIEDYLWLRSDLKGSIEAPGYYMENNNAEGNEALDNLLLSQGWTKFNWDKILTGDKPQFKFLPEYTGHIITGHIVNSLDNTPAPNINAYLTVPKTPKQLFTSKSDSTGQLLFNVEDFYGISEMVAQTNQQQDSTYRLSIASPFSQQYSASVMPAFTLSTDMKNVLVENSVSTQVLNIFAAAQLKQFNKPELDSARFYGEPTKPYRLDDYRRFPTVEEILREYVVSTAMTRRQGKMGIRIINNKAYLPGSPLVTIDGTPVFDIDKAYSLDLLKVKQLDVVANNYLYGPVIFNGILGFTTYKGDRAGFEIDPRSVILDYEGLQLQRKFYSPVYENDQQSNSPIPDFRNALYWNPDAGTDKTGNKKLTFYAGDKAGKYVGIIEGITTNGEAGSTCFYFEVKK